MSMSALTSPCLVPSLTLRAQSSKSSFFQSSGKIPAMSAELNKKLVNSGRNVAQVLTFGIALRVG